MEEAEPLAQGPAVCLDRLPDGGIPGVVVDHQHLEAGIVQPCEGVERFDQHLRRFIAGRHVDRDHGQVCIGHRPRLEQPSVFLHPQRLGPLMRLDQQHPDHPDHADQHQQTDEYGAEGQVLMRVFMHDPHRRGGGTVGDHGEEAAAAAGQGPAVDQQQGEGDGGNQHRDCGELWPVGDADDGIRK